MIGFEELQELLSTSGLKTEYKESEAGMFNRVIEVEFNGVTYLFEWWKNLINIYINKRDGAQIVCDNIELSHTWPNRSKMNIQCDYYGKTMFIIPLEPFKIKPITKTKGE